MAGYLFVIKTSVCEKVVFMINEPLKTLFFIFLLFRFSKFQRLIVKNLMKKPSNFIMDFKSLYKFLVYYKFLSSENFRQWNNGPFKEFLKSARKRVLAVRFL